MKNIASILSLLILLSCNSESGEKVIKTPSSEAGISMDSETFDKMGLQLGEVQTIEIAEVLSANGVVDVPPENIAEVSYPLSGFIKSLGHNILEGTYVKKGSSLATVQSMELIQLQQDYLQFYNQRTFLAKDLERQKALNSENAGSQKALEEAQKQYDVNKSMIASYEAKLQLLNLNIAKLNQGELTSTVAIRAPFSGYIQKVHINTGTNFSPEDVLFEMLTKNHLHVELKLFEKDAFKVKKGQKVVFQSKGISKPIIGEVFLVGQSFESDSKAINVHVHIPNREVEQQLIPGQYLSGSIYVDSRQVSAIPEAALLREEGKTYVYQAATNNDGSYTFLKKAVTIGTMQNGMAELESPLDLKDIVVNKVTFLEGGFEEE